MPQIYQQTAKETLEKFKSDQNIGLSATSVQKRQKKYGKNQLTIHTSSLWKKILAPFSDIFMAILLVALALSAVQSAWLEVAMIVVIIAVDAIIYWVQQFATDRILRSLSRQITDTTRVLRAGRESEVAAADLVPGDIVLLGEGARIPADGRIIEESGLLTNESMLTGESAPVRKNFRKLTGTHKIYERTNMVFSGSFVVTGAAKILITSTGNDTEYGRIASLASSAEPESPIQKKINRLVFRIAIVVVALALAVFIIQIIKQIPLLAAIEFTLAMIVSAIPEGLPITISIILALGARRMARRHALIKETRAIESIGIITTIASDKTGTLTENKLSVRSIWAPASATKLPRLLAESAVHDSSDPLDLAIEDYIKANFSSPAALAEGERLDLGHRELLQPFAFDNDLKMSGNLYLGRAGTLELVIKGAPEAILSHSKMNKSDLQAAELEMAKIAGRAQKVIALATARLDQQIGELANLPPTTTFTFQGLFAVADPIRPEAEKAISDAAAAGVTVKMITGDHFATAKEIGKELGLVSSPADVFDCSRMDDMSAEHIATVVKNTTVFARVTPELKFKILSAMKAKEIVAMTGDGVNDVPALSNAHVGISMGSSPSIVQDASDIVLLDDNFRSITTAIREGRIILTNIRRMLLYLLSTNAGEVLTILGALMLGSGQILTPIQILWVNLVTDSLLVVPIGLEPAESRLLRQKPEAPDAPILSRPLLLRMALIASTMAILTLATYFISLNLFDQPIANTLAFTSLVVMQWANALNARGARESIARRLRIRHPAFLAAFLAAISLQALALFSPLSPLLNTVPVPPLPLIIVTIISFTLPILVVEIQKARRRKPQ